MWMEEGGRTHSSRRGAVRAGSGVSATVLGRDPRKALLWRGGAPRRKGIDMSKSSRWLTARGAVTLALACSLVPLVGVRAQGRYPGQEQAIGAQMADSEVRRFGRIQDPAENQMVQGVLAKLIPATHLPGLSVHYVIVRDTAEPNAYATFGGWVVVKQALFDWFRYEARKDTPSRVRQNLLVEQMLSAVLAHELSHVTLGHLYARPEPNERDVEFITRLELQADRQGAMLLSASGGHFQWMVDLVQSLDDLEGSGRWQLWAVNYFRDHPRGSARAAALLQFKSAVLADQSRFDDAVARVSGNFQLDVAIEELDSILDDFPTLIPALHLRATAYHYQWLNSVPREQQQMRVVLPIYVVNFGELVRGAPGDVQVLRRARDDYASVLRQTRAPYTLSNIALLDAYDGNLDRAAQEAQEAYREAGSDPLVLNNVGVVLYLCNDRSTAAQAFAAAVQAARQGRSGRVPLEFVFNLGKTLHQLGDPSGDQLLVQYVQYDQGTEWRREAEALLRPSTGNQPEPRPSAQPAQPAGGGGGRNQPSGAAASSAPSPGGVALGSTADQVVSVMGRPSSTQDLGNGIQRMLYEDRGLAFAVTARLGVCIIFVGRGYRGDVDGVRAGDRVSALERRWGRPAGTMQDGTRVYDRTTWAALVYTEGDVVTMIAIVPHEAIEGEGGR